MDILQISLPDLRQLDIELLGAIGLHRIAFMGDSMGELMGLYPPPCQTLKLEVRSNFSL